MQFNQARNLIKKLIKCKLLLPLVLINNCKVKTFAKRSSILNLIYSGQQQFNYKGDIQYDGTTWNKNSIHKNFTNQNAIQQN